MPELPEVESVARMLRDGPPSLVGRRVAAVNLMSTSVVSGGSDDCFKAALEGSRFLSVDRYGKYLLLGLQPPAGPKGAGRLLVIHLRMTGRLFLVPDSQAVARHTRLALMLDKGLALRFDDPRTFGRAWLVDDQAEVVAGLGPDALSVGRARFAELLARHRRQLKPLLLDQGFLAGIGNIYADEILFRARLHPLTLSSDLSAAEADRLHAAVTSVLEEAVSANGANIDGVFKAGAFLVSVYGRQGEPCNRCGAAIVKTRVGQRGTHFCPECQQRRASGA